MNKLKATWITATMAASFAMVGMFFSVQEVTEQSSGYDYEIELVSLSGMKDLAPAERLHALTRVRDSVMTMAYIPVPLKRTILVDLEEEIFDVKAAMERAKSARLGKSKSNKDGAAGNCEKCLSEKQDRKPEVRRFLEGQSWV